MITVYGLATGESHIQKLSLEDVAPWTGRDGTLLWIDLEGPDVAAIQKLAPVFGLHPLAVEDTLEQQHFSHPKADDYGDYLFVVLHSARWDRGHDAPVLRELDIFVGHRFLITAHGHATRAVTAARDLCERRPELLRRGPSFLLHHLLDIVVTNFHPVIELIDERLDEAEREVFARPTSKVLNRVFALKRGLLAFRRVVGPERDTLLALTRDEFDEIAPEARPYFRDVYDRLARVSDLLESYRDEIATLLEIHLSIVSNRINEVMKTLTVLATVLMTLGLVVGYYGMNFQMAEYKWKHGELYVLGVLVVAAVGVWYYMRNRKLL